MTTPIPAPQPLEASFLTLGGVIGAWYSRAGVGVVVLSCGGGVAQMDSELVEVEETVGVSSD